MNTTVNGERGLIKRKTSLDDVAIVIYQQKVGGFDLAEGDTEGVNPEMVSKFWVSRRYVTRYALLESELRKHAKN
tara:strand:- start:801 stop:1025 length:225 start_codon:yes stop_codon:yes gene_type:complete